MSGHSLLAPSSSSRWLNCTASLKYSDNSESSAAKEGTAYHLLAYICKKYDLQVKSFAGRYYEISSEKIILQRDMCNAIQRQINWLFEEHGDCDIYLEVKVPITDEDDGTLDYCAFDGETLWVADWKFGRVQVDAEENTQLSLYAHGVCEKLQIKPSKIFICIMQPRVSFFPEIWETDFQYLASINKRAKQVRQQYNTNNLQYEYSVKNCIYCPARFFCPEVKINIFDRLRGIMSDLKNITLEDKVFLVTNFSLIQKLFEKYEEDFIDDINSGKKVPGLKLIYGKAGKKTFSDEEEAAKIVEASLIEQDLPVSEAYNVKLKTPNQILDLLGSETPESLVSLIKSNERSIKLVPESQKGEEYTSLGAEVFND